MVRDGGEPIGFIRIAQRPRSIKVYTRPTAEYAAAEHIGDLLTKVAYAIGEQLESLKREAAVD
jgi:hypothetical protein